MKPIRFMLRLYRNPSFLFYSFLLVLLLPNILLSFTEHLNWAGRISNILFPLAVYYNLLHRFRSIGKTFLWLFPFVFLSAFQIVLLYLFHRSIIAVDMFLNLVTTNPTEAMELLDNMIPVLVFVVLFYIPVLIAAVYAVCHKIGLSDEMVQNKQRTSRLLFGLGALSLITAYLTDNRYEIKSDLFPVNVCYNIGLACQRTVWTQQYEQTSAPFTYNAQASHPAGQREIYVMVVGETSRACNWSLAGYSRTTTPQLAALGDELVYFPYTLSESNTTHKSVPMLLSSVSAVDFDSIYSRKGIVTAFREAGFSTAFLSNQRLNHSFIDLFGQEAEYCDFIKEDSSDPKYNPSDDELLKQVSQILAQGNRKQFIVLHTYGSHFNYKERYQGKTSFYTPDGPLLTEPKFRNSLLNAYDNTIRYTDLFLAQLIEMLQHENAETALIYTSDHGEDIFDDSREMFLHASPVPTYYQIHVPFLVWTSAAYRTAYAPSYEALLQNHNKNVSSSASFFHTMLHLAGIQTPYRQDSLSVASPVYTERPRVYLNDHNVASPLNDTGMDSEDFEMLQKYRIGGWDNTDCD